MIEDPQRYNLQLILCRLVFAMKYVSCLAGSQWKLCAKYLIFDINKGLSADRRTYKIHDPL